VSFHRLDRNAFKLTANEQRLLSMRRDGLTPTQIAEAIGYSGNSGRKGVSRILTVAFEKERLMGLRDLAPKHGTSLRKARGIAEHGI
jgi:hypothetical protein